jgi:pilus assembly protein Flp/PilA
LGAEKKMRDIFDRFLRDERGVTAIEYGLIGALIAVVIIVSVRLAGTKTSATFSKIANNM